MTKLAHFIRVRVDYNTKKLTKIYVKVIVSLFGVPYFIISNKDTIYTSTFGIGYIKILAPTYFSTLFHCQTDRLLERIIQVLKDIYRVERDR